MVPLLSEACLFPENLGAAGVLPDSPHVPPPPASPATPLWSLRGMTTNWVMTLDRASHHTVEGDAPNLGCGVSVRA